MIPQIRLLLKVALAASQCGVTDEQRRALSSGTKEQYSQAALSILSNLGPQADANWDTALKAAEALKANAEIKYPFGGLSRKIATELKLI